MPEYKNNLSEQELRRLEELRWDSDFMQHARKPVGDDGLLMIRRMNGGGHAQLAEWGFPLLGDIAKDSVVLDAGCGGGANLARWCERCPEGLVYGLDFSEISVEESLRYNANNIANGLCKVVLGDVSAMPFESGKFDYISAFETIYFWPDLNTTLREISRVLKTGGTFFICNESDGHDAPTQKASTIIKGLTVYDATALEALLLQAGFGNIHFFTTSDHCWLAATAKKM